jgi:hypothetical protein
MRSVYSCLSNSFLLPEHDLGIPFRMTEEQDAGPSRLIEQGSEGQENLARESDEVQQTEIETETTYSNDIVKVSNLAETVELNGRMSGKDFVGEHIRIRINQLLKIFISGEKKYHYDTQQHRKNSQAVLHSS